MAKGTFPQQQKAAIYMVAATLASNSSRQAPLGRGAESVIAAQAIRIVSRCDDMLAICQECPGLLEANLSGDDALTAFQLILSGAKTVEQVAEQFAINRPVYEVQAESSDASNSTGS